ncbi:MAG: RidA family protein [Candidatus Dadabacteria bacterium]|nr:MAG: RidA family protein [Candidatus Dadabacteria bacterium]
MTSISDRLSALGIELPEPPAPAGMYVPALIREQEIWTSGMLPVVAGELRFKGVVGRDLDMDDAVQAARLACLNGLAAAAAIAGSIDRIAAVLRVEGYVAGTTEFTSQATVLNGASELLVDLFGDAGRHTRVAIGVPALPLGAPVEISLVFRLKS